MGLLDKPLLYSYKQYVQQRRFAWKIQWLLRGCPVQKRDAGSKVLSELGYTASPAINELYDYILKTGRQPFQERRERVAPNKECLAKALAFVDSIAIVGPSEFDYLDKDEPKRRRLIDRGLANEEDFA